LVTIFIKHPGIIMLCIGSVKVSSSAGNSRTLAKMFNEILLHSLEKTGSLKQSLDASQADAAKTFHTGLIATTA
jgi:hypothetical protein